MRILVPFDSSDCARRALDEARRIVTPLDELIVLAAVVVPPHLPVDVAAGDVWKATCAAERHLLHARHIAGLAAFDGISVRCVRVQARSVAAAAVAGAAFYAADTILLVERSGLRGRIAALFDQTATIIRQAPCDVQVIYRPDSLRAIRRAPTWEEYRPIADGGVAIAPMARRASDGRSGIHHRGAI